MASMQQGQAEGARLMLRLENTEKQMARVRKLYYRAIGFSLMILVAAPITLSEPFFPVGTIIMGVMLAIGISQVLQFRNRLVDLKIEKEDLMAEGLDAAKT